MSSVRLGLRENLAQFSLLVVVNAFVGAMVGMERTILPPIAEQEFHLAAKTAVLSFIVVFGVTISALLTVFVVPALYSVLARRTESPQYVSRLIARLRRDNGKRRREVVRRPEASPGGAGK